MTIALDYDGTYTADPDLWCEFIWAASLPYAASKGDILNKMRSLRGGRW